MNESTRKKISIIGYVLGLQIYVNDIDMTATSKLDSKFISNLDSFPLISSSK